VARPVDGQGRHQDGFSRFHGLATEALAGGLAYAPSLRGQRVNTCVRGPVEVLVRA
jgi:hypothetical protein